MHLRIWPQAFIGRVILVLMCAVVLEFIGSSAVYEYVEVKTTRLSQAQRVAEQLVVAAGVMNDTPPEGRAEASHELSTEGVRVTWQSISPLPKAHKNSELAKLAADMRRWEPTLDEHLRVDFYGGSPWAESMRLMGSVKLKDGTSVLVISRSEATPWATVLAALGSAAVMSIGLVVASTLLLRSLGLPLRALAQAAESVGKGDPIYVREEGAGDLRRVAHAFNAMQTRITELLAARTHALAAVSHDLRTPLSRLRLRAGLVKDRETRAALEQDVEEMADMLNSLLAYLGGAEDGEAQRLVDLAALCMTIVDNATDAGGRASYEGPDHLSTRLRPSAVKRAIDNLVQNALIYGGGADVSLSIVGDRVVVRVCDDGPGIPESQMARVKEAFTRLDDARSRNTAGLGLGLSTVEKMTVTEGGEFVLANRPEGGLCAEIRLPYRA
ncbi:MAG: HAMP domain-containing protein [Caulobacterales bacterium]|nr:HAMP domain-containing protein [Caulobacterales bacterium]